MAVTLWGAACATGCGSPPEVHYPDRPPKNTQLAVSPDGSRLLVSWHDESSRLRARLVELDGSRVTSSRSISLPAHTLTTSFGSTNDHILVTTMHKGSSNLFKIDLQGDATSLVYKSPFSLRFPAEVGSGTYVFLEGTEFAKPFSKWHWYKDGRKTLVNDVGYTMAAPLQVIDGALLLLEPWSPPAFRVLHGKMPGGLSAMIDKSTFLLRCADQIPLTCLRTHLHQPRDQPWFGTMQIGTGGQWCPVPGRRWDEREVDMSADGSTVVFHSALERHDGPRALYVIKNVNQTCEPVALTIPWR